MKNMQKVKAVLPGRCTVHECSSFPFVSKVALWNFQFLHWNCLLWCNLQHFLTGPKPSVDKNMVWG